MSQEPIRVYLKPGCTTCKRALDYLSERGAPFETIDLFKQRLSREEIKALLSMAGVRAREALRKKDRMYKQLDLDKRELGEVELLQLMAENPGLILRPILVRGDRAVVAVKPELASRLIG